MKILILLLLFISCSNQVPTNRTDYRLQNLNGFIISNIYVHPDRIYEDKHQIKFEYKIIVKNITNTERPINLNGAFIMIGLRSVPIACTSKRDEPQFVISAHETMGIDCKILLNKQEGVFQISDFKSMIEIPLDSVKARFAYLLRAEDFQ